MGKQRKKPVSSKKKDQSNPKNIDLEVGDVITKADASLESSDLESALHLYKYAAKQIRTQLKTVQNPNEDTDIQQILTFCKVLSKLGETKVSLSQHESAKLDFLEAYKTLQMISIDAIESKIHSMENFRFECMETKAGIELYLAQLHQGDDALEYFQVGIQSLLVYCKLLEDKQSLQAVDDTNEERMHPNDSKEEYDGNIQATILDTRRQLSKAYCSIAELFLTDLCYEPDAEIKCEEAIQNALIYDDKSSPDALQALANLRLSQSDKRSDAYTYMLEAYQRMRVGCEALAMLVGLGGEDDTTQRNQGVNDDNQALELKEDQLKAVHALPPFEFRCQSVKILLECASIQSSQPGPSIIDTCVEASIQILGSLLAENDEVPEIYYLLGTAFMSGPSPNLDSARFYMDRALEMTENIKQEMEMDAVQGMHDEEWEDEHEDILTRVEEIRRKISEMEHLEQEIKLQADGH